MGNKSLVLILDNIRSRENVGSIFRTADAAGVTKIYLCGITPRPPHEKISKTALGAEDTVDWEYSGQTWRLVDKLKKFGYKILALEQSNKSEDVFKFKIPDYERLALIVGNEVSGIGKNILNKCNHVLEIPMVGKKESLNVSVATGVAVFELLK
jgi:tRNA G18 (ribose-2'-O)-methylase SpoU